MKIVYGKPLTREDVVKINSISLECGILFDTARLLFYRNIDTAERVKKFLNPTIKNLHNPFLFRDMQRVVDRISQAKKFNQRVLIFGDYDVDGISATALIYNALKDYGITADYLVPEREQGYGLNLNKILELNEKKGVDLLITVDCGISERDNIEILKRNGIEVIVSDHHEAPEILPNCLIVNPKTPNESYPFSGLCGAGVAYKIATALIGENANKYLDFVAVATVADSMDLIDENRDIIFEGLKLFKPDKIRSCFKYLLGESAKEVNSNALAYQIAPRINAGGRMGDALTALKLFMAQSEGEMFDISVQLNTYNMERQKESQSVYESAKDIIAKEKLYKNPVICVKGEDWNHGVSGIVAAKLVEDYNRPVIVFANHDNALKGSARSIDGVNVHTLLSLCQENVLGFGGHAQAAGISVSGDNYDKFYAQLIEKMNETYKGVTFEKTIYCDWRIDEPISLDFAREINSLEPFGIGNKKPLFSTTCNQVNSRPLKENSPHYAFETEVINMLDFNGECNVEVLDLDLKKEIIFEINYSVYRGRESAKGFLKKVIPDYADFQNLELEIFRNELLKLNCQSHKPTLIDYDKNIVKKGYGTVYVASDFRTLEKYQNADNIKVSLFYPQLSTGENQIIVSLRDLPAEYDKIVYLDKPMNYLFSAHAESYAIDAVDYTQKLSTDRNDFALVYTTLVNAIGANFTNSVDFYKSNQISIDAKTFIFATEVFLQLNFFDIRNGLLIRNSSQKNELTNSTIYSRILEKYGR